VLTFVLEFENLGIYYVIYKLQYFDSRYAYKLQLYNVYLRTNYLCMQIENSYNSHRIQ